MTLQVDKVKLTSYILSSSLICWAIYSHIMSSIEIVKKSCGRHLVVSVLISWPLYYIHGSMTWAAGRQNAETGHLDLFCGDWLPTSPLKHGDALCELIHVPHSAPLCLFSLSIYSHLTSLLL
jgi:hypothetical protein